MPKTSVQLFYASIENTESRLFKTCNSLLSLNIVDKVFIVGFWIKDKKTKENISENIQIQRIVTWIKKYRIRKGVLSKFVAGLSFISFCASMIYCCVKIKPNYISCHNVQILPAAALAKFFTGAKLIYEPHELETEKTGLGRMGKMLARLFEKLLIGCCYKVVTVCEPITQYYKQTYNLTDNIIFTIRNVPVNPALGNVCPRTNVLRDEFYIPSDSIVYIYQGLIDNMRGLTNYLDTFAKLDNRHHLVLMGFGDGLVDVLAYEERHNNIHYKPAVSVDEIIKYTASADVGLHVIPGELTLSYRYSLPNKFYEYAIAGLFICVANNFEFLSDIVNRDKLGVVVSSEKDSLYRWIKENVHSKAAIQIHSDSIEIRKNYGWQNEEKNYQKIYE